MDLSVVIVNYNTADFLSRCLHRLLPELAAATTYPPPRGGVGKGRAGSDTEVFVVDNGSSDGSAGMVRREFPTVMLLENGENLGFARANNRALRLARGRHVLLLNPDTEVQPGSVAKLERALDTLPDAVAVGPKIVRPDGRLDLACRRTFPSPGVALSRLLGLSRLFPRSRRLARYNRTYEDPDRAGEIDAGTAAALCFRLDALQAVGFFDEDFFMYGEDLDLCYRLRARGGRIYYLPSAVVLHHKGEASRQQPRAMLREFHRAMWLFYRKHYASGWQATLAPAVWLGIRLRYGLVLGLNAARGRQVVSP